MHHNALVFIFRSSILYSIAATTTFLHLFWRTFERDDIVTSVLRTLLLVEKSSSSGS